MKDEMKEGKMLDIGKVYKVSHNRKGVFYLRISSYDSEWVGGTIVEDFAKAIMEYNVKEEGEKITVRRSFCKFKQCE